ncbi:MAG: hypothetical protein ABJH04_11815 [Cyclobacteriaceae bacterium]
MMMRIVLLLLVLSICNSISYGQQDERITTIDFVQILNDNREEAVYYFQNNWKVLRDMAVERGYIDSFQVLEVPASEKEPFQLMLITTYVHKGQYDLREDHFRELISEKGPLKLLNEKKPEDFRKTLFSKEMVRHWK